jgi:hypothetical protein
MNTNIINNNKSSGDSSSPNPNNFNSNSSGSNNPNDNATYENFNKSIQLDESKLNNLKYNLLHNNTPLSLKDIINYSNLNNTIKQHEAMNQSKSKIFGSNNDSSVKVNDSSPKGLDNLYLKNLIFNKINHSLTNTSITDKILLYNLLCSNKYNQLNPTNNINITNNTNQHMVDNSLNDFMNNMLNTNFSLDIEKHFQKEVVRYTIENFCKYLKENGYEIIKNESKSYENQMQQQGNICSSSSYNQPNIQDNENIIYSNNSNIVKDEDMDGSNQARRMKELICPHTDKKHYAKNLCNTCYHRQGRSKKAWLCPHTYKVHYARGKCRNCYLNFYHKVSIY